MHNKIKILNLILGFIFTFIINGCTNNTKTSILDNNTTKDDNTVLSSTIPIVTIQEDVENIITKTDVNSTPSGNSTNEINDTVIINDNNISTNHLPQYNYIPRTLPPQSMWYDVTQSSDINCDGVKDDSNGFKALINDKTVTNWFIPESKTCKFFNITIQPHLKAIHGGGKIVVKGNQIAFHGTGSNTGALILSNNIDGLLIDNIDFSMDTEGWTYVEGKVWVDPWNTNGVIAISGKHNNENIEIRNCNVDLTNAPMDFIKGYLSQPESKKVSNIAIVNNTIIGFQQFAIEILGGGENLTFDKRPASNIKILRNKFIPNKDSRLKRCISMPFLFFGEGLDGLKDGTESYIADNWFIDVEWGMETSGSSGIYVQNNLFTGKTRKAWHDLPEKRITGVGTYRNYYFHNVVIPNPTASLAYANGIPYNATYIEVGSGAKIYENYIGTKMVISKHKDVVESTINGLHVHDNLFSIEGTDNIKIEKAVIFKDYPVEFSTFKDNEFYLNQTQTGLFTESTENFINNEQVEFKPTIPSHWGLTVPASKVGAQ